MTFWFGESTVSTGTTPRLEAVYGVLQNEEIEASFADVSRIFAIMDKEDLVKDR